MGMISIRIALVLYLAMCTQSAGTWIFKFGVLIRLLDSQSLLLNFVSSLSNLYHTVELALVSIIINTFTVTIQRGTSKQSK